MPSAPPPPPPKNTRQHPRFDLFASVELHGAETVILPARNISLGGVYLTSDGHDLTPFAVGVTLEVLVFDVVDEQHEPVRLSGQVVRHDEMGMALMWAYSDPETAVKLGQLLQTLQTHAGR